MRREAGGRTDTPDTLTVAVRFEWRFEQRRGPVRPECFARSGPQRNSFLPRRNILTFYTNILSITNHTLFTSSLRAFISPTLFKRMEHCNICHLKDVSAVRWQHYSVITITNSVVE